MKKDRKDLQYFRLDYEGYSSLSDVYSPDYSHFSAGTSPYLRGVHSFIKEEDFVIFTEQDIDDAFQKIELHSLSDLIWDKNTSCLIDTFSITASFSNTEEELVCLFNTLSEFFSGLKEDAGKILNKSVFLFYFTHNLMSEIAKIRASRVLFSYILHRFSVPPFSMRTIITSKKNDISDEIVLYTATTGMSQGMIVKDENHKKRLRQTMHQSGLLETIDPLGGSYFLERETAGLIQQVIKKLK